MDLRAPADVQAEAVLAASACTYTGAWQAVEGIVGLSDFTQWRYRRVVEVCLQLPERCPPPPITADDLSWVGAWWVAYSGREIAAINAGAPEWVVKALRDHVAAVDPTPAAQRMREATTRRAAMTIAADLHNLLGTGATLDEVQPLIERLDHLRAA